MLCLISHVFVWSQSIPESLTLMLLESLYINSPATLSLSTSQISLLQTFSGIYSFSYHLVHLFCLVFPPAKSLRFYLMELQYPIAVLTVWHWLEFWDWWLEGPPNILHYPSIFTWLFLQTDVCYFSFTNSLLLTLKSCLQFISKFELGVIILPTVG